MARYFDDYRGISGHDEAPRGMDPNYRGGYHGMRMNGRYGQAEYGRYRRMHQDELGQENGMFGMYGGRGPYTNESEPGYDRGYRGGARRGPDPRMVWDRERGYGRDFGAGRGGYDRGLRGGERGLWSGYSNRGLNEGGYSDGWAWGPMRGSR